MIGLIIPLHRPPIQSGILGQLSLENYIYTTTGCHLVVYIAYTAGSRWANFDLMCFCYFAAILLYYCAIFVNWFIVLISMVGLWQYRRFFLRFRVWVEFQSAVYSRILFTFNICLCVFEVTDFWFLAVLLVKELVNHMTNLFPIYCVCFSSILV